MATRSSTIGVTLKGAGAPSAGVASREEAHAVAAQIIGDASLPDAVTRRATPRITSYSALRTFVYGGDQLDRGQVFRLKGLVNDKLMVDLKGYMAPIDVEAPTYPCRVCGLHFIDPGLLNGHGKERHEPKRFTPPTPPVREDGESRDNYQNRLDEWALVAGRMSDSAEEQRERIENELAPLDLENTAASRKG